MTTHVKIIAVLFLVAGVVMLMGALFSSMLAGLLASLVTTSGDQDAGAMAALLGLGGVALVVAALIFSIPSFICAWGLLKLRNWARVMAIILGSIALIKVPVGTLFGVYVLVVMFRKDTEALFGQRA